MHPRPYWLLRRSLRRRQLADRLAATSPGLLLAFWRFEMHEDLAQQDHVHRCTGSRLGGRHDVREMMPIVIALGVHAARRDDLRPVDGQAFAIAMAPVTIDGVGQGRPAEQCHPRQRRKRQGSSDILCGHCDLLRCTIYTTSGSRHIGGRLARKASTPSAKSAVSASATTVSSSYVMPSSKLSPPPTVTVRRMAASAHGDFAASSSA